MATIPDPRKNRRVALIALSGAAFMLGLAYASVPLYRLFCQATGFGGTPQKAEAAPDASLARTIKVRFDANTSASLGWNFQPAQLEMTVKIGEQSLAYYKAKNLTAATATGTAGFNVTPEQAGAYFNKIECFCFTEQTLKAGEATEMPVSFFVDPAILDDPDAASIDTITLSYTFSPADKPESLSQAKAPAATAAN
jgi:cytochrome c oxidase assembly protein subunit 11